MTKSKYGKLKKAGQSNKGGLHRALHIPEGDKIPSSRLTEALHSGNEHVRKMANLAKVFKGFKKK